MAKRRDSGRRDLSYSFWRRRMRNLPMVDLDSVEFHNQRPIAVLELTTGKVTAMQERVIAATIRESIPCFSIHHTASLDGFEVSQFAGPKKPEGIFGWRGFTDWIHNLRGLKAPNYVKPVRLTALDHIKPWLSELTEEEKDELARLLAPGDF